MYKPKRALKFYDESFLEKILGVITHYNNKDKDYPYKIFIFDRPIRSSDEFQHIIDLKVVNNNKKIKLKSKEYFKEDDNKDYSEEISKDLYNLLIPYINSYNNLEGKRHFLISLSEISIEIKLR